MHPRLPLLAFAIATVLAACAHAPSRDASRPTAAPATAASSAATIEQPPLTALTADTGVTAPAEQQRVHFDHAALHFKILPTTRSIEGNATLTFSALEATDVVVLDLDRNLAIGGIDVDGKPVRRDAWSNPDGRLRIRLPQPLAKGGHVDITVRYGGQPHVAKRAPWDGGFVWATTPDGKPWVASAVQGQGCDLFWPCIDQPEGEPDLVDTYVTVQKDLSAPGNGVLIGIEDQGDWRTWHWRARHPDTYAVAIDVGPFKELTGNYKSRYGNTIPMQYWYLPGDEAQAKELFASFPRMLDFFEQEIGPYPWGDEKMGVVQTPHEGMEHQTINAYGNKYALDGNGFDWLLQHEFSHEWFGNQVTNSDWDDMWIHEGFGTYMQPLYAQYLYGDMPYFAMLQKERLAVSNKHPIVSGHHLTGTQSYGDEVGSGLDMYYKASLVLHSLRNLIGDKDFFEATRRLVYGRPDPKPGNFEPRYASTKDFVAIVDKVTGRKLDWFFDVYLYQAKLPTLDVQHDGDTLTLHWQAPGGKPFPMPVEVELDRTVHTLAMTHGEGHLHVPAGTLYIVDPHSKVLREMPHIDAYQVWMKAQRAKRGKDHTAPSK